MSLATVSLCCGSIVDWNPLSVSRAWATSTFRPSTLGTVIRLPSLFEVRLLASRMNPTAKSARIVMNTAGPTQLRRFGGGLRASPVGNTVVGVRRGGGRASVVGAPAMAVVAAAAARIGVASTGRPSRNRRRSARSSSADW